MNKGLYGFPRWSLSRNEKLALIRDATPKPPYSTYLNCYFNADVVGSVWKDVNQTPAANGDLVYAWADLSGKGNHATTGAGTNPTLTTLANCRVLYFASKYLSLAVSFVCREIFVVIASPTANWSAYGAHFGHRGGSRSYLLEPNTPSYHYNPYPVSVDREDVALTAPFNANPINVLHCQRVTPSDTATSKSWDIGRGEATYMCNIYIRAILTYNTDLTTAQQTEVYNWMKSNIKW